MKIVEYRVNFVEYRVKIVECRVKVPYDYEFTWDTYISNMTIQLFETTFLNIEIGYTTISQNNYRYAILTK